MIFDFIKESKVYLIILLVLGLVFFGVSYFFYDSIVSVDELFIDFINKNIVNENLTIFMKLITNLGSVFCFVSIIILIYIFVSEKKVTYCSTIILMIAYIVSVVFKNLFRRERPVFMLIDKLSDFSFPSGHTMCSIAFYGFLIYVVNKCVSSVNKRRVINIFLVLIMMLVPFSRLYLGVHFFTDIVGGILLGVTCLLMFINYVKIKEII